MGKAVASFLRDANGGLAWLITDPIQRRMLLTSMFMFPCFNAFILVTMLNANRMHTRESLLMTTLIGTSLSVGSLVGALLTTVLIDHVRGGVLVFTSTISMGMLCLLDALAASPIIQMACICLSIVILPASNAVLGGFGALLITKPHLGRVYAAEQLLEWAPAPAITFLAGIAMQHFGYRPTAITLCSLVLLFALPSVTSKAVITIPKPGHLEEHIDRYNISRY